MQSRFRTSEGRPDEGKRVSESSAQPVDTITYRPPSTRRIGLPVRVIAMSDSIRFPETFGAVLAARRAAEREATILLIWGRAIPDGGPSMALSNLSFKHLVMSSRASTLEKWI